MRSIAPTISILLSLLAVTLVKAENLPNVMGVTLGGSIEEVMQRYEDRGIAPIAHYEIQVRYRKPLEYSRPLDKLRNEFQMRDIDYTYIDGKLQEIIITYDGDLIYEHLTKAFEEIYGPPTDIPTGYDEASARYLKQNPRRVYDKGEVAISFQAHRFDLPENSYVHLVYTYKPLEPRLREFMEEYKSKHHMW